VKEAREEGRWDGLRREGDQPTLLLPLVRPTLKIKPTLRLPLVRPTLKIPLLMTNVFVLSFYILAV